MTADVVVVGAGVIGAATAFHLSLLGAGDVLVLDRATAGSGMSCRSSALVRMHYTFGPEVELAPALWQPDLVASGDQLKRHEHRDDLEQVGSAAGRQRQRRNAE